MEPDFNQFRDQLRRKALRLAAWVSKLFESVKAPVPGFASSRMCPFCGLITPRAKSSCLECGKSLTPVRATR